MNDSSIHRQVAAVRDTVGWLPRLRPLESVQRVVITDDTIRVLVQRVRCVETAGRFKITHYGRELTVWTVQPNGYWKRDQLLDWTPADETVIKFDIPTIKEVADKKSWERDCYRPGSARFPMDREAI